MRLTVRVTPRGGHDAVEGWVRDAEDRPVLKVRVSAAASDGAANAAVLALLAKTLGRPKSTLTLVRGETARLKQIEIDGLDQVGFEAALGGPSGRP